jgi:hypothetical protein
MMRENRYTAFVPVTPGMDLGFHFEMTQRWHDFREPYHLRFTFTDFENIYKSVQINAIELELTNNKKMDLLTKINGITIPGEGRDSRELTKQEIAEFQKDKVIRLSKDETYKVRVVTMRTGELGFKSRDVKEFTIKIEMKIQEFNNNIIDINEIYTFKQVIRKEKNYLTV